MSVGYFQIALGRKYIDESCDFIHSLRLFEDNKPVSVLVKPEDIAYAKEKNVFDQIINLKESGTLYSICENSHDNAKGHQLWTQSLAHLKKVDLKGPSSSLQKVFYIFVTNQNLCDPFSRLHVHYGIL